jgi:glucosamine 6-phosphate synthetase-like amidotransferase/phosphosugar isomerase protein
MCGIIGFEPINKKKFSKNFEFLKECLTISSRRGSDASGIFFLFKKKNKVKYLIIRSQNSPKITLKKKEVFKKVNFFFEDGYDLHYIMAHTRLSTNGESTKNENNQPLINEQQNQILIFNGIVANYEKIIFEQKLKPLTQNDGEIFFHMSNHQIKDKVEGSYSVIVIKSENNKLNLNFFSNTGSIYFLKKSNSFKNIILSEESFFKKLGLKKLYETKN